MLVKITNKGEDKKVGMTRDSLYLKRDEEKEIDVSEEDLDLLKADKDLVMDVSKRRIMD